MKYSIIIAALIGTLTFEEIRSIQLKRDTVSLAQLSVDVDAQADLSDEEGDEAAAAAKVAADVKVAADAKVAAKAAAEAANKAIADA